MIVDFHTHVFPRELIASRARLVEQDAVFGELYGNSEAKLATADDLLESMARGGIDVSVALGFSWTDESVCRLHNDCLLEAAHLGEQRILPFCSLPLASGIDVIEAEMRRCVAAGARGFGELRPHSLGFDLGGADGGRLAGVAVELGTVLLFHVTEPVGHAYAGKHGLSLQAFHEFVSAHPDVTTVGAHWGGGLPFYARMPEVRQGFGIRRLFVDTAASSLLYDQDVYVSAVESIGPQSILFGSDYPLLSQKRSRERIEAAGLDKGATAMVLGGNAAALLGLA